MINLVAKADTNRGKPEVKLNRSRKNQTSAGMPPKEDARDALVGSKPASIEMNSVVMKNNAKNVANFTRTERRTNPKIRLRAETKIPNISSP